MAFCTNCGASVAGAFCTKCGKPVSSGAAPIAPSPAPDAASTLPPAAPARKTSPLVWILVAIGGLVVLFVLLLIGGGMFVWHKARQAGIDPELMRRNPALAATKMITAMNPNIEVISVDENGGLITIRDKQTGKTVTVNFEDVKRGRISFKEDGKEAVSIEAKGEGQSGSVELKSAEGSMKIGSGGKMPSWIPAYPASVPQGDIVMQTNEGQNGSFHFTTKDAPKNVISYYEQALKQAGFKINSTTMTESEGSVGGILSAEDSANKRTVVVTIGTGEGSTTVNVGFQEKK